MTSNWPWALIHEEPLKQSRTIKCDCSVTCLEAVRSFWSIKTHGCVNHMRNSNIGLVYIWYWDPSQVIGDKWSETCCLQVAVTCVWSDFEMRVAMKENPHDCIHHVKTQATKSVEIKVLTLVLSQQLTWEISD